MFILLQVHALSHDGGSLGNGGRSWVLGTPLGHRGLGPDSCMCKPRDDSSIRCPQVVWSGTAILLCTSESFITRSLGASQTRVMCDYVECQFSQPPGGCCCACDPGGHAPSFRHQIRRCKAALVSKPVCSICCYGLLVQLHVETYRR